MIPFSSAISGGLTFSRIPRSRNYELKLNGEAVGTLVRPSFWCAKYEAETAHGRWTFRRGGFLSTGAEIVDANSNQPIAAFRSCFGLSGTLTFPDGQVFRLEHRGFWRPVWSVTTQSGQPILLLRTCDRSVELQAGALVTEDRRALLSMFTWYMVLKGEEEAAAAAVIATS